MRNQCILNLLYSACGEKVNLNYDPLVRRVGDARMLAASRTPELVLTRGSRTFTLCGLFLVVALSQLLKQPPGPRCV